LPDEHYDEFVLRGQAPDKPGPLWFKVLQQCERGEWDWAQVPAVGTSTKELKAPAVLLEVLPNDHAAHAH
jgi:periplasmic copper chaperone A